jgi:hypothetical protein
VYARTVANMNQEDRAGFDAVLDGGAPIGSRPERAGIDMLAVIAAGGEWAES